jgi:hypothetical protein
LRLRRSFLGGCCSIITSRSPPRYPRKRLINRLNRSTILDSEITKGLYVVRAVSTNRASRCLRSLTILPSGSARDLPSSGRFGLPPVRERAQPPILNDYRNIGEGLWERFTAVEKGQFSSVRSLMKYCRLSCTRAISDCVLFSRLARVLVRARISGLGG